MNILNIQTNSRIGSGSAMFLFGAHESIKMWTYKSVYVIELFFIHCIISIPIDSLAECRAQRRIGKRVPTFHLSIRSSCNLIAISIYLTIRTWINCSEKQAQRLLIKKIQLPFALLLESHPLHLTLAVKRQEIKRQGIDMFPRIQGNHTTWRRQNNMDNILRNSEYRVKGMLTSNAVPSHISSMWF